MQFFSRPRHRHFSSKLGGLMVSGAVALGLSSACSGETPLPDASDAGGSGGIANPEGSGGTPGAAGGSGALAGKPEEEPPKMNLGGGGGDGPPPVGTMSGGAGAGGSIQLGGGGSGGDLGWIGPCAEDETVLGAPGSESDGVCCGCTCADPRWSCSEDTCLNEDGLAEELAPEAGFLEISGGSYRVEGEERVSPHHRLFYSFHPAQGEEADRPLLVFFNGGPGSPTSALLFAFNTAPLTLDPRVTDSAEIAENPHDFSRAFHLLYVDAPGTGFSYPQPLGDGQSVEHRLDMQRDAAELLKFLLLFLEKHPRLADVPVGLVGESYGGTRAALMMDLLEHFDALTAPDAGYSDLALYDALLGHFQRRFPALGDGPPELGVVREQFGHQVLIQPALLGSLQLEANPALAPCSGSLCASRLEHDCVADPDYSQCDVPRGSLDPMFALVAQRLTRVEILSQMLGVDPTSIAWLRRCDEAPLADETQLPFSVQRFLPPYPAALTWSDPLITMLTVPSLVHTKTFITHARHDRSIDSMNIISAIDRVVASPSMTELRADLPSEQARPGELFLRLGDAEATIRFPHYRAGHLVTMNAPGDFYDDLVSWWE